MEHIRNKGFSSMVYVKSQCFSSKVHVNVSVSQVQYM